MEYDLKTSKQIISDLCAGSEFIDFKEALKQLNTGIENSNVEAVTDSIISIGKARDLMLERLNSAFKYKIEKYLTSSQIENITMESCEDSVSLVYKHYVPSYIKEGIYTSVDMTLLKVNFKDKKITMPDVEKEFNEADKYSNDDCEKGRINLNAKKAKIDEMKINRDSMTYVINTVKNYDKVVVKNNAFERIKCLLSRATEKEYVLMYDEILVEMIEDYEAREEDFNKSQKYDYSTKMIEVRDLQQGLLKRLSSLHFDMVFENPAQKIKIKHNPIELLKAYQR